jgi:hypothetical protein
MEHIKSWSVLMMLIYWVETNTIKKNTEALLEASRETGLEVNTERTKYIVVSLPKCRTNLQFTDS